MHACLMFPYRWVMVSNNWLHKETETIWTFENVCVLVKELQCLEGEPLSYWKVTEMSHLQSSFLILDMVTFDDHAIVM